MVPRIIMPSRPMLTTPARSDHKPARPASAIGMNAVIVSRRVPAESSSLLPVMTRANEISMNATSSQAHTGMRRPRRSMRSCPSSGARASLAMVMRGPLRIASEASGSVGCSCRHLLRRAGGGQLLGDRPLLGGLPVATDDLVGHDDAQHEHALGDGDDVVGDAGVDLQQAALLDQ